MTDTEHMENQMTNEAYARWLSLQSNTKCDIVLYEVMPDGGFQFGVNPGGREWRTFAVNSDGGKAYPLTY